MKEQDPTFSSYLYKCSGWDRYYSVDGCWARPTGYADEWREVIDAMKTGLSCSPGIRLEARKETTGYVLSCPRNQVDPLDSVFIPMWLLKDWIEAAEEVLEAP